jgi:hypothetical protein
MAEIPYPPQFPGDFDFGKPWEGAAPAGGIKFLQSAPGPSQLLNNRPAGKVKPQGQNRRIRMGASCRAEPKVQHGWTGLSAPIPRPTFGGPAGFPLQSLARFRTGAGFFHPVLKFANYVLTLFLQSGRKYSNQRHCVDRYKIFKEEVLWKDD